MAEERQLDVPLGGSAANVAAPVARVRRFQRRRFCAFCVEKIEKFDYKDVSMLRRFISDQGQIDSRRRSARPRAISARLTLAVKRARILALLPYTAEHVRQRGD